MTTKELIQELLNYPMDIQIDNKIDNIVNKYKPFPLCKSCEHFDKTKMNEHGIGFCKLHNKEIDRDNSCEYHEKKYRQ